jgi:hypothetical protein
LAGAAVVAAAGFAWAALPAGGGLLTTAGTVAVIPGDTIALTPVWVSTTACTTSHVSAFLSFPPDDPATATVDESNSLWIAAGLSFEVSYGGGPWTPLTETTTSINAAPGQTLWDNTTINTSTGLVTNTPVAVISNDPFTPVTVQIRMLVPYGAPTNLTQNVPIAAPLLGLGSDCVDASGTPVALDATNQWDPGLAGYPVPGTLMVTDNVGTADWAYADGTSPNPISGSGITVNWDWGTVAPPAPVAPTPTATATTAAPATQTPTASSTPTPTDTTASPAATGEPSPASSMTASAEPTAVPVETIPPTPEPTAPTPTPAIEAPAPADPVPSDQPTTTIPEVVPQPPVSQPWAATAIVAPQTQIAPVAVDGVQASSTRELPVTGAGLTWAWAGAALMAGLGVWMLATGLPRKAAVVHGRHTATRQ